MGDYRTLSPRDISERTYWLREKLWWNNLAENLPRIRNGRGTLELKDTCAGPCVVVGAGPSIEKFGQFELLKKFKGHVIATDRMLVPLLKEGIVPEYVVSVDGDEVVADFYKDPIVENARVKAVFNSQVHPSVAAICPGEIFWFSVVMDNINGPMSVSRVMYWMTGEKTLASSYGNAGGFAWALGEFLGHRIVILVGMDLSYGPDVQPMNTTYWNGFLEMAKGKVQDALKHYRYDSNPFGFKVVTDDVFNGYREVLHHGIQVSMAKTINCSPYTVLHGTRISTMSLEEALKRHTLQL